MSKIDFSTFVLTPKELCYLRLLQKNHGRKKTIVPNIIAIALLRHGLIQSAPGPLDGYGTPSITDDYYILEDGRRYLLYRDDRFREKKLPIIISVVALIGAYRQELSWLLQAIARLLK